jgi:two-component system, OmpR family, response regulator RegX3
MREKYPWGEVTTLGMRDIDGLIHVLIAQRDKALGDTLRSCLADEGYHVEVAEDGADVWRRVRIHPPHIVLLDYVLPDAGGIELCRRIRRFTGVPVVFVSSRGAEADIVLGLDAGAADYIVVPFRQRELVARIRAILRRVFPARIMRLIPKPSESDVVVSGCVSVDGARRVLTVAGRLVDTSRTEFDLLYLLMSPVGRVRTRDELIDRVWSGRTLPDSRALDTYIRRLRLKVEEVPSKPVHLTTVRGVGFRFDHNAVCSVEVMSDAALLVS